MGNGLTDKTENTFFSISIAVSSWVSWGIGEFNPVEFNPADYYKKMMDVFNTQGKCMNKASRLPPFVERRRGGSQ